MFVRKYYFYIGRTWFWTSLESDLPERIGGRLAVYFLALTSKCQAAATQATQRARWDLNPESANSQQWTLTANQVRDLATIIGPAVVLYCYWRAVQLWDWLIVVDHLLDEKATVTIYFCLIKYHQGNVIEMVSEKASFLKKLLKNI
jgi:hypothetical protein